MSTNEGHPTLGDKAILVVPGNYQPVHWEDTIGAIFLGIFAIISLIGWQHSESRYRKLLTQREKTNGNNVSDHR